MPQPSKRPRATNTGKAAVQQPAKTSTVGSAKGDKRTPKRKDEKQAAVKTARSIRLNAASLKEENNVLAEPDGGLTYWLGGRHHVKTLLRSEFDVIEIGEVGVAKASLDLLATHLGISRKVMAEDILDISVKTMERKGAEDKLDKRTSSHVLEIARVLHHAYEVFEDVEKVRQWLSRENRALEGRKPLLLLGTLTGINMVNNILLRIEEGVYS